MIQIIHLSHVNSKETKIAELMHGNEAEKVKWN